MTSAELVSTRQEYLTGEEVADIFRTTSETVRFWRHIGEGPRSFRVGRRVLYARADLEDFLAEARETDPLAARREAVRATKAVK